jgi:uncharacterized protein
VKVSLGADVDARPNAIFAALNDLERVVSCLPGASLTGQTEDGAFEGEFALRIGPFATVHRGTVRIETSNKRKRTARLAVSGHSGSGATVSYQVARADGGARLEATAELVQAGPLGLFASPTLIEEVANRLLRDFTACLAKRMSE